MLSNLYFCLNATVPIFLLMLLGMLFLRIGWFSDEFVTRMNGFVFRVCLPVLLFGSLGKQDFRSVWDGRYVLFCFLATAASILLVIGISFLLRDRSLQGEFIQASYRSSAAILGMQLVENIYGNAGMTPLMILGAVPLYNIMAVVILSFFQPVRRPMDRRAVQQTIIGVLENPIIIGIVLGLLWSLSGLTMFPILDKTVDSLGRLATPLGVMALGASFDPHKAVSSLKAAGLSAFIKLIGLGLLFVPLGIMLGFRGEKLVALMIMCGSPTTVSCFVMARELGHDGTLTASCVMLTFFLSIFTLTGWLFVLKSMGLI